MFGQRLIHQQEGILLDLDSELPYLPLKYSVASGNMASNQKDRPGRASLAIQSKEGRRRGAEKKVEVGKYQDDQSRRPRAII